MRTHAVLFQRPNGYAFYLDNEEIIPIDESVSSLPALMPHVQRLNIETLWIMPETDLARATTAHELERIDTRVWDAYYPKREKAVSFVRLRAHNGKNRYFAFPGNREWKPPADGDKGRWYIPTPYYLYETVKYITEESGLPVMWSPGHMGVDMLRTLHGRAGTFPAPLSQAIRPAWDVIASKAMDRPIWRKLQRNGQPGLSEADQQKTHIIGLDKNAQFIGAASSVTLGDGDYTRVQGGAYTEKAIGFWKYRITDVSSSLFNGYDLYCPLDVKRAWASTELIRAARYVGVKVEIDEGIVWASGKKYMERWAKDIFAHRVNMRNQERYPNEIARENAEGTFKSMANSMVGRLNNDYSASFASYHHPDWNLAIIHQAIASQCFSLNALARRGIVPCLVSKDAFYVLADSPDATAILDPAKLDKNTLGGFKVLGTARLTPGLISLFAEKSRSTSDVEIAIKHSMEG